MAQKEAIAIILDVGPSMNQAAPGFDSPLKTSIEAITMILQRKIFAESKDEVSLILCGSEETENDLADGESYQSIKLARELAPCDWGLMQYVQKKVIGTNTSADFIDAVVVAVDHLVKSIEGKRGFVAKRVILFSDLGSEFGNDGLDDIVASLKHSGTELNVIGPNLDDDDSAGGDGSSGAPGPSGASAAPVKEKTAQQRAGEAVVRNILNEIEGACYSFNEALSVLSYFQTRGVKQVAWKAKLELGDELQIPVCGYLKVKEAKKPTFKKVYAKEPDSAIERATTFHLNDEDATEIEREQTVKGYRYGSTLIPFGEEDEVNMKYQTEKGMLVLGFTPSENIKRHYYLGDSVMVFVAEKGDESASVALSALITALYETDHVIICRRVYAKNSQPKMGFLSPHIKANYECLIWNELPYSEDIRTFTFGSLPLTEEAVINKKYKPSADQLAAVDELIDNMDLTSAAVDEDGDAVEALKPKLTFNPYLQRLFQCTQYRMLEPDQPLQELQPLIADYLKPPQSLQAKNSYCVDELKKKFKLTDVSKKKRTGAASNVFKEDETDEKKVKVEDDDVTGLADMKEEEKNVTEVGTVTPVEDFLSMLKDKEKQGTAAEQMQKRILQLVTDSFGAQFYAKAMECLKCYREQSISLLPDRFNTFLTELRDSLKTSSHSAFWVNVADGKISLITSSENASSSTSQAEADQFLQDSTSQKEEEAAAPGTEDADDLLDML